MNVDSDHDNDDAGKGHKLVIRGTINVGIVLTMVLFGL